MEKQKPSQTAQSTGKVFVMLLTNQINESQQCQEEQVKRQERREITHRFCLLEKPICYVA